MAAPWDILTSLHPPSHSYRDHRLQVGQCLFQTESHIREKTAVFVFIIAACAGSGHSQHSRSSSTSSSISSTTGLSQDSALQPHPQPHSMTAIAQSLTNSGPGHHISAIAASTAYETSTAAPAACGGSSGSTSSAQAHSQGNGRVVHKLLDVVIMVVLHL